jgi:hypothetical protein
MLMTLAITFDKDFSFELKDGSEISEIRSNINFSRCHLGSEDGLMVSIVCATVGQSKATVERV